MTIEFERGVPVSLNGERLGLVALIERVGEIGARHGVGIVDHIEDRIVGLKVRDIYEVPAATILLLAHKELETLVGTIHQHQVKPSLDQKWAYLVYAGLWWEPLRTDLDAYMDAANEQVTGTIGIKLYKGSARVVTRSSPNAVYDAQLATFHESGGLFSQDASPGFIELWSLQSRMAWRVTPPRRRVGIQPDGLQASRIRRLARRRKWYLRRRLSELAGESSSWPGRAALLSAASSAVSARRTRAAPGDLSARRSSGGSALRPERVLPSRPMSDPGLPSALGIEAVEWFAQDGGGDGSDGPRHRTMAPAPPGLDRTADARRRRARLPPPLSRDARAAEPDRCAARHLADQLLGSCVDRAASRRSGVAAAWRRRDPVAGADRALARSLRTTLRRSRHGDEERSIQSLEIAVRPRASARGRRRTPPLN